MSTTTINVNLTVPSGESCFEGLMAGTPCRFLVVKKRCGVFGQYLSWEEGKLPTHHYPLRCDECFAAEQVVYRKRKALESDIFEP